MLQRNPTSSVDAAPFLAHQNEGNNSRLIGNGQFLLSFPSHTGFVALFCDAPTLFLHWQSAQHGRLIHLRWKGGLLQAALDWSCRTLWDESTLHPNHPIRPNLQDRTLILW